MSEKDRKRTKTFLLRLLDEEMKILNEKAKELSMSKTEFLRNIILFGTIKNKSGNKENIKKLLYELNRIGNNINQIAYHVNSKATVNQSDFIQLKDEYINLLALFEDEALG